MVTGIAGPVYLHRPGNDRAQISLARSPFFFPPTTTISHFPTLPLEMSTSLDYLKATGTVVVSDSGDFECKPTRFHPSWCLTNHQSIPTTLPALLAAIDAYKPQVREFPLESWFRV